MEKRLCEVSVSASEIKSIMQPKHPPQPAKLLLLPRALAEHRLAALEIEADSLPSTLDTTAVASSRATLDRGHDSSRAVVVGGRAAFANIWSQTALLQRSARTISSAGSCVLADATRRWQGPIRVFRDLRQTRWRRSTQQIRLRRCCVIASRWRRGCDRWRHAAGAFLATSHA